MPPGALIAGLSMGPWVLLWAKCGLPPDSLCGVRTRWAGLGRGAVGQERDGVVIYWRPDCVFCLDLLLRLKFTRLRYRKVGIGKDPDARAFVRSVADGNETVPTVVVAGHALVNPSKRQLIAAVRTHAPHALSVP
jgi:glutaredoxin